MLSSHPFISFLIFFFYYNGCYKCPPVFCSHQFHFRIFHSHKITSIPFLPELSSNNMILHVWCLKLLLLCLYPPAKHFYVCFSSCLLLTSLKPGSHICQHSLLYLHNSIFISSFCTPVNKLDFALLVEIFFSIGYILKRFFQLSFFLKCILFKSFLNYIALFLPLTLISQLF